MKIETIARLFNIACSRLLGEDGNAAVYHLGRAMALYHLSDKQDPGGSYYEYMREVGNAKKIFRVARRMRNIKNLPSATVLFNRQFEEWHGDSDGSVGCD